MAGTEELNYVLIQQIDLFIYLREIAKALLLNIYGKKN